LGFDFFGTNFNFTFGYIKKNKKMKHIQLFENYELRDFEEKFIGNGKIKIGYTGDGGNGSHPSIFSKHVLENLIPRTHFGFTATASTDNLPEALVCIFDDDNPHSWFIQPISSMVASKVIGLMGKDHLNGFYENDYKNANEILRLVGYNEMTGYNGNIDEIQTITIIPSPKLNTIYWSDNPEHSHGYWEPPYEEITLGIS